MNNKPKFLDSSMVESVVTTALGMFFDCEIGDSFKRNTCHVVVAIKNPEGEMEILYEKSHGNKDDWEAPYDQIARHKASLLMTGRHDGRTSPMPHLLYTGDTPYWGGVEHEGLVVTCSGIQPWFDRMIAGTIAHMCVGWAYDVFEFARAKDQLPDILD